MKIAAPLLAAMLAAAAPARAQDETRYQTHLAAAREHEKIGNWRRAHPCYLAALAVRPGGAEAWLGLAQVEPGRPDLFCLREALRRAPDSPAVKAALAGLPGAPRALTVGTAARLEARYLGRPERTAGFDQVPGADVGSALVPELLVVQGLDGEGNLVPVDPALEPGGPEIAADPRRPGRLVARAPSLRTRLAVRDRKSGQTATVELRLVGPPARVKIWSKETKVGPGELLHLQAGVYDAAGNRLWVPRLVWTATGGGTPRPALLARAESLVSRQVGFEPHRNIVLGPAEKDAWSGALAVTLREPESGLADALAVQVVKEKTRAAAPAANLAWETSLAEGLKQAKARNRPLMVFFTAEW